RSLSQTFRGIWLHGAVKNHRDHAFTGIDRREKKTANAVCQLSPFWNTNERVGSLITELILLSGYFLVCQ
ncbi:hypothetical protein, partial [Enterobacter hormaechei]|uniref:hypothetical protein n=1 Tax=Enterobacter hormaechei TaxID=158836 RepID=UPI002040ADCA